MQTSHYLSHSSCLNSFLYYLKTWESCSIGRLQIHVWRVQPHRNYESQESHVEQANKKYSSIVSAPVPASRFLLYLDPCFGSPLCKPKKPFPTQTAVHHDIYHRNRKQAVTSIKSGSSQEWQELLTLFHTLIALKNPGHMLSLQCPYIHFGLQTLSSKPCFQTMSHNVDGSTCKVKCIDAAH